MKREAMATREMVEQQAFAQGANNASVGSAATAASAASVGSAASAQGWGVNSAEALFAVEVVK